MTVAMHPVYRICRAACHGYFRWLHGLEVRGLENVPREGGCILAANHSSLLDPPLLGCAIRWRVVHYLAKDALFRGLLGWLLPRLGTVPLDRSRGDVAALRRAIGILQNGGALGLFPEGTRSSDGRLQPAKSGVGFLVARARVPVVPAWLRGTREALPKGARWPRFRPVAVEYGRPITPDEIAAEGAGREAYERIAALIMARIAALAPATGGGDGRPREWGQDASP